VRQRSCVRVSACQNFNVISPPTLPTRHFRGPSAPKRRPLEARLGWVHEHPAGGRAPVQGIHPPSLPPPLPMSCLPQQMQHAVPGSESIDLSQVPGYLLFLGKVSFEFQLQFFLQFIALGQFIAFGLKISLTTFMGHIHCLACPVLKYLGQSTLSTAISSFRCLHFGINIFLLFFVVGYIWNKA
jgi:hypothetical protein